MKVLFVGLGNVSVMHGWALSGAGVDVTHVVRPGTLERHSAPVAMDVLDLRRDRTRPLRTTYRPRVVDEVSPGDGYGLLVVATGHPQAAAAAEEYGGRLPETDVLMFTADWDGTAAVDAVLPRERYLWGYSVMSGGRDDDGALVANIQPTYRIGALPGSRPDLLDCVVELFGRAGLAPDRKDDIIAWLWTHHALVAGLIGASMVHGGLPAAGEGLDPWVTMVAAARDGLAVAAARGVAVEQDPEAAPYLAGDVEAAAARIREAMLAMPHFERTRHAGHLGSAPGQMLAFYRDVVTTGERLGVEMPVLASFKGKLLGADG
jgi:2-dehydropantoate 2-reductase